MNLSAVLTRRVADTGGRDPDTLHGLLMLAEERKLPRNLASLMGRRPEQIAEAFAKARGGLAGRVPPVNMSNSKGWQDGLDGVFSKLWKREVIALMLRPDGASADEIAEALRQGNSGYETVDAVSALRVEARLYGVDIETSKIPGTWHFRHHIAGQSAARMQEIIANGWAQ
jgi:hypothetical protein